VDVFSSVPQEGPAGQGLSRLACDTLHKPSSFTCDPEVVQGTQLSFLWLSLSGRGSDQSRPCWHQFSPARLSVDLRGPFCPCTCPWNSITSKSSCFLGLSSTSGPCHSRTSWDSPPLPPAWVFGMGEDGGRVIWAPFSVSSRIHIWFMLVHLGKRLLS
jgi:hypothetical protein